MDRPQPAPRNIWRSDDGAAHPIPGWDGYLEHARDPVEGGAFIIHAKNPRGERGFLPGILRLGTVRLSIFIIGSGAAPYRAAHKAARNLMAGTP